MYEKTRTNNFFDRTTRLLNFIKLDAQLPFYVFKKDVVNLYNFDCTTGLLNLIKLNVQSPFSAFKTIKTERTKHERTNNLTNLSDNEKYAFSWPPTG